MALTLAQQWAATQSAVNQQAVRMAMLGICLTIVSEAAEPTRPVRHQKRHDLAVLCLRDPDYWQVRFLHAGLALDQAAGYGSDALIISALQTVFEKIAGVDAQDLVPIVTP
ncbi:MAG: hypothetical protein V4687_16005 [Bacteroidota bacterium]